MNKEQALAAAMKAAHDVKWYVTFSQNERALARAQRRYEQAVKILGYDPLEGK